MYVCGICMLGGLFGSKEWIGMDGDEDGYRVNLKRWWCKVERERKEKEKTFAMLMQSFKNWKFRLR